jgi:A/G-specific adenine glycosylase
MAKRRVSSDDLSSDEEYTSAPSARKARKAKQQPAKKKQKTTTPDDCPDATNDDIVTHTRPHASSTHTISAPKLLRVALLEWYAGVHETRGMPWRKPYDPSLGHDGRAQRAYEVSVMLFYTIIVGGR